MLCVQLFAYRNNFSRWFKDYKTFLVDDQLKTRVLSSRTSNQQGARLKSKGEPLPTYNSFYCIGKRNLEREAPLQLIASANDQAWFLNEAKIVLICVEMCICVYGTSGADPDLAFKKREGCMIGLGKHSISKTTNAIDIFRASFVNVGLFMPSIKNWWFLTVGNLLAINN